MHNGPNSSALAAERQRDVVKTGLRLARTLARLRNEPERGSAIVEFAMVVPLLVPMLVLVMEFGSAFNYKNQLTQMASQGARWAAVNKNPGPGASLQESIADTAVGPELKTGGTATVPNPVQVCIEPGAGKGDAVTVTAQVTYSWLPLKVPFLEGATKTFPNLAQTVIRGSSTMMLEKAPDAYQGGCFPA
jgi:Flp pilus assembly protein TadG